MTLDLNLTNFTSLYFFIFLFIVFFTFWLSPLRFKPLILLLGSYLFYASYHLGFFKVLIASNMITFLVSILLESPQRKQNFRKTITAICIIFNVSLLIYFKYRYFFGALESVYSFNKIIIPLGISFFTLQSIGYTLDVYRRKITPTKNFFVFSLFIAFFPIIIAGPIERAKNILPQLTQKFSLKEINFDLAVYYFIWGFFKKYLIADSIAEYMEFNPSTPTTHPLILYISLLLFLIRVYCDFSGYSKMAQGIAQLFGINLIDNFNFPLFANSPQDFWERWHISLGRWVKNYFYTPLLLFTGTPYISLFIVFPMMGLWHGSNWLYLVWGLSWAVVIFISKKYFFFIFKIKKLNTVITLNLAIFLIIFYKVKSMQEFSLHIKSLALFFDFNLLHLPFAPILILATGLIIYEYILHKINEPLYFLKTNFYLKTIFYLMLIFIYRFYSGTSSQDIFYMQY